MTRVALGKNIAANYVGRIWSIASIYLFVPVYLRLLGVEAFGIINFQAVILGVVFFADAGLASAMMREMARTTDRDYLTDLLTSTERVYICICISVAVMIVALSNVLASGWLQSGSISDAELSRYIKYIGVTVGLQFSTSLYHGVLMGLQRQGLANALQVGFGIARSALVIIPLLLAPTLDVFLAWQFGATLVFVIVQRHVAWWALAPKRAGRFDKTLLISIAPFSIGMMAISMISGINTQLDKLLTSKLLPLVDYAHYALASIIAQAPVIVTLPIALAVLPRLTGLAESGGTSGLTAIYHRYSYIIASLAASVGAMIFVLAPELTTLWIGQREAAVTVPVTRILVVGGILLALQLMPYHLALAHGHNRTNVRLGLASLCVTVPLMIVLTGRFGLVGAALPWLLTNMVAFLILGVFLTRRFLPGEVRRWFGADVGIPVALGLAGAGLVALAKPLFVNDLVGLAVGVIVGIATLGACGLMLRCMDRPHADSPSLGRPYN